ncbi:hypothetical protein ACJJTC_016050 [Scirpophaga incertulas]
MASKHRRVCINSPNKFCYICGRYVLKSQCRHMNEDVKKAYFLYFGCKIGDQDKQWAPHSSCVSCHVTLIQWLKGNRSSMPYAVLTVWREPTNHFNDCYFCLTNTEGYSKKKKKNIDYPTVPSAIKPVPHGEGLPVPTPPLNWEDLVIPELNDNEDLHLETAELLENTIDPTYIPPSSEPQLIQQNELNDLARDLGLSKQQSELLGSRLQEWNLLAQDTTITSFRKRNANFSFEAKEKKRRILELYVMNKVRDSTRIIATIETRYQGRWDPAMLGDYCWFLKKEDATPHKRKK